MKRLVFIKWAILSICLALFSGCDNKDTENRSDTNLKASAAKEANSTITFLKVPELINDGTWQVIDIRDQYQYIGWSKKIVKGGHIKNAIDFPLSWVENAHYKERMATELMRRGIDINQKTLLYADETISEEVARQYQALGFKQLAILEGGFKAYLASGYMIESLEGFARFVHPQWLQDLIDGEKPETYHNNHYLLIELGFDKKEYLAGHIKGAIQVDASRFNDKPGLRVLAEYDAIPLEEQLTYWDFPSDDIIQKNLETYGITPDTTVILYATDEATTAVYRAILVMDYAGVKDIRILNGGKTLWQLEGRPLDIDNIAPQAIANFGIDIPQKPEIYIDYTKELELIRDPNAVIASIRSWPEYLGKISGYTYIGSAGDIEGSRFGYAGSNPYAMEDYRNLDNTLFNYKLVEKRWNLWGISADKYVSFHCGTGWRASETYYIAEALGWKKIGVFVGGWYQWSKIPNSPVKAKGLPKDAPEQEPQEFF